MKAPNLRVLCLAGLAVASITASGSLFARDYDRRDFRDYRGSSHSVRDMRHDQRSDYRGRFDHHDRFDRHDRHDRFDRFENHGRRHNVVVTHYNARPHVIERRVIVEQPVYYAPVSYAPPPSLGQVLGGFIGGVIDDNR